MSDDYRVKSRSDQEIRQIAKKARAFFGVADDRCVDVLNCLKHEKIWTLFGTKALNFQVRPDKELGISDGSTIVSKEVITITVKQSVRDAALMGDGRSRNTLAHELGHGVMHDRPVMFRQMNGNVTPKYLKAYESAEHRNRYQRPTSHVPEFRAILAGIR
jgi:hypothetical protein